MKRKALSFIICICICLSIVFTTFDMCGISLVSAAGYTSELWLIDDVEYALVNGSRIMLGEGMSPYKNDTGTMYLPLSVICGYTGAEYTYRNGVSDITLADGRIVTITEGSCAWTLGGVPMTDFLIPVNERMGEPFISILMAKDIFGVNSYYDNSMGLLVISKTAISGYNTSLSSIQSQINTASSIIMDRPSGDTIYNDLVNYSGADVHPRLLVTQDKFDEIREVFKTGADDDPYSKAVQYQYRAGDNFFNQYFSVNESGEVEWKNEDSRLYFRQPYYIYDENGNRLVGKKTYTYTDAETGERITLTLESNSSGYGDGYDYGGRSAPQDFTVKLRDLAYTWQVTEDSKYSDAFYLLAKEMGAWEHWGDGHFLNCADASYYYAIGFDWIYHAFDDEPEKRKELAEILYEKGVMMGYYSLSDSYYTAYKYMHISNKVSGGWITTNRVNNWQSVCGAGMIVSSLAIMEYDEYRENAKYVTEQYIHYVEKCLYQYAPDGSNTESPGYWQYGTNALLYTYTALKNSCGRHYGYGDIIGLHESFYYAIGIADSESNMWNYHDANYGKIDYSYIHIAAQAFDDENLTKYRNFMIYERERSMSLMDVLFCDRSYTDTDFDIPLDYNFRGIQTATFRSSFDKYATYTGLHAGPSIDNGHGDFDSGSFFLTMGGINWCCDPGSENYNVQGFWNESSRYHLYCKSIEGHNAVVIRSNELPYGQAISRPSGSHPEIDTYYSDELGGYAITDMTSQYGSTCISGQRGVLMTNSRRTVVLQDEITFSEPTSLTWVLNLIGTVQISDDGRTLVSKYAVEGEEVKLRATLITDDENLKFSHAGIYETVLDSTVTRENSGMELAENPERRVFIKADGVTDFNVAVVFQIERHKDEVTEYEMVPMNEWTTADGAWIDDANSDIDYTVKTYPYGASDFARAIDRYNAADSWAEKGKVLRETAKYLSDYDKTNPNVTQYADVYISLVNRYNYEIEKVNQQFNDIFFFAKPSS